MPCNLKINQKRFLLLFGSAVTGTYWFVTSYLYNTIQSVSSLTSLDINVESSSKLLDYIIPDNSESDWGFHVRITPQTTYYHSK